MVLRLQDLPWDFRISAEVRSAILRYVKERIEADLADGDPPIVLLRLSYEGRLAGAPHSLALRIQLSSTADVSDFALSYLLDSLRQSEGEITEYLRRLDSGDRNLPDAFKRVNLFVDTYNFGDVSNKQTNSPSRSPSHRPIHSPILDPRSPRICATTNAQHMRNNLLRKILLNLLFTT